MSTYNGRNSRITVNSASTEAIVTEIGEFTITRTADEIDTTAFGAEWAKSDVGMKKYSGSFSGSYDPADTTGQAVIEAAYDAGTILNDIRFYILYSETAAADIKYLAPASGSTNGIRITSLDVNTDKNGVAKISCSFSGSGELELVETTVSA